jgi:hypothetical protein
MAGEAAAEAAVEDSALDEAVVAEVATAGTVARIQEIREVVAEREGNFPSVFFFFWLIRPLMHIGSGVLKRWMRGRGMKLFVIIIIVVLI